MIEIELPQLGETVSSGVITAWFKSVGDSVVEGEPLYEIETEKVSLEVPSSASGTLSEIRASEGETVEVGAILALVSPAEGAVQTAPSTEGVGSEEANPAPKAESVPSERQPGASSDSPAVQGSVPEQALSAQRLEPKVLSPMVRKLIKQNQLDVSALRGSGLNGRITRRDVERYIDRSQGGSSPPEPREAQMAGGTVPFNRIRQVTGERMVESKAISPHVLTAVEVDYEAIEEVRTSEGPRWKEEHGVSLTYLPFICRALSDALTKFPMMNASVGENELVLKEDINIGIAVDLEYQGLLAPVVRNADGKRIVALAREISDLAMRARTKKLTADELSGGTFTISNSGSFGTFMVAPIINQPQVAILSTDGVSRKPVVVKDERGRESIAIHSVGMLVLCWDHRAFDGAYAAAFMRQLKINLETFDWEMEL